MPRNFTRAAMGLLAASVMAQSLAAAAFKLAASRPSWPELGQPSWMNAYYGVGLAALATQTVLWAAVLRHLPLSRAHPFMACTIPLNILIALAFFDETLRLNQALGLGVIALGVWLVATGSVGEEGE